MPKYRQKAQCRMGFVDMYIMSLQAGQAGKQVPGAIIVITVTLEIYTI
jgi:hypothetical protein